MNLKEEEIRIHKANESANKDSGNYSDSKIETIGDVKNINDISYIVDHKQDIVVPKGKHLYINDKKTIGTDYVFRYNTETNKYHIVRTDGKFSYTSYTLNEISKAVIK